MRFSRKMHIHKSEIKSCAPLDTESQICTGLVNQKFLLVDYMH